MSIPERSMNIVHLGTRMTSSFHLKWTKTQLNCTSRCKAPITMVLVSPCISRLLRVKALHFRSTWGMSGNMFSNYCSVALEVQKGSLSIIIYPYLYDLYEYVMYIYNYIYIYMYYIYIYDKWWMSCGVSGGAALHCWAPSLQITRPRHGMAVICHREYRDISCRGVARCRQATRGRWKALSSVAVVGWSGSAAVGGWLIETWRASKGGKVWDGLHSHVNSRHSGRDKEQNQIQAD